MQDEAEQVVVRRLGGVWEVMKVEAEGKKEEDLLDKYMCYRSLGVEDAVIPRNYYEGRNRRPVCSWKGECHNGRKAMVTSV